MKITIVLKNGQKHQFLHAGIQKKDNGRSTAVYDSDTYRIIAEFKAEQILVCQSTNNEDAANLVLEGRDTTSGSFSPGQLRRG